MLQNQRVAGIRRAALAVMAVAAMFVVSACGGASSLSPGSHAASVYTGGAPGGTPVHGGTATVDSAEAPASLDPITINAPGTINPSVAIFDTLVELVPGNTEPQPALATSWSVNKAGTLYTFHLREGVDFSNGQPLTAKDVIFSLERARTSPGGCEPLAQPWKQLSTPSPTTVQLRLRAPYPTLIDSLTVPCFAVISSDAFKHEGAKQFGLHPVGTGPFMLESATPGFTAVTVVRNPHYWRSGQPYLNSVVFNQVENQNSRILAVRSGAASIALGIPYSQVATLKSTPGVRMLVQPLWGSSLNVVNTRSTPLNQINVRKALEYAIPYQQIIKSIFKGLGQQSNSIWGTDMKYWDSSVPYFNYDVAKAKQLLRSSSVPNGFNLTLDVESGESANELMASILQSSWAQMGVHVKVQTLPFATLLTDAVSGKFAIAMFPLESAGNFFYDPNQAATDYLDAPELPPTSLKLKAMIEKVTVTQPASEREALFHQIQRLSYAEEAFFQPIVTLTALSLTTDAIHNFSVLPSTYMRMNEVWVQH